MVHITNTRVVLVGFMLFCSQARAALPHIKEKPVVREFLIDNQQELFEYLRKPIYDWMIAHAGKKGKLSIFGHMEYEEGVPIQSLSEDEDFQDQDHADYRRIKGYEAENEPNASEEGDLDDGERAERERHLDEESIPERQLYNINYFLNARLSSLAEFSIKGIEDNHITTFVMCMADDKNTQGIIKGMVNGYLTSKFAKAELTNYWSQVNWDDLDFLRSE